MRDDFGTDIEEYLDLRPEPKDKKFSYHLWNNGVVPTCRKLVKLRKVNRVEAGFDSGQGKVYRITAWTTKTYGFGGVFAIRPVSGGISWQGRDLSTKAFFEGDSWDTLVATVADKVAVNPALLEHLK